MNDPRRLRDEESSSSEMREFLASAPSPGPLPSEVYGRGWSGVRRRAVRQRYRRIALGTMASAAAALAALGLLHQSGQISSERVVQRAAEVAPSRPVPPAPPTLPSHQPTPSGAPSVERYLAPLATGWLNPESNPWGAQGAFYVDASIGSTVLEPARPAGHKGQGWMWSNAGSGKLCLKGSSAGIEQGDFKQRWGVLAGMELCHVGATKTKRDRSYSITQCPGGEMSELKGVRFELEGPEIPAEMRVVFSELNSKENAFVALYGAEPGPQEISMDKARVSYQRTPRSVRRDRVRGVEWLVPSRLSEPAPFDFCVKNIELF